MSDESQRISDMPSVLSPDTFQVFPVVASGMNKKVSLAQLANWLPTVLSLPLSRLTKSGASNGQVIVWDGLHWVPKTVEGSDVITASGIECMVTGRYDLTDVQAVINDLYYVAPSITSLSNNIGVVEVGQTVTSVSLSWTLNKTMTSLSLNNGIGDIDPGLTVYTHEPVSITSNTTYTLTAGDGSNTTTRSTSFYFRHRRWRGTSPNTELSSSDILALGSSAFDTNRSHSFSIDGNGEYIWICYPAAWGEAAFTVNGLASTAWTRYTVSHTNASGHTENYYCYRSNTMQNGTGISIEVS